MTIGRDGSFKVELVSPILHSMGGPIESVTIHPVSADHMIRWEDERIPSFYALLAELSGVPEQALLKLSGVDLERVMFAFTTLMTPDIRDSFVKKERPYSTAYNDVPHPQDAPPDTRDPLVEPFPPHPEDPRYPDIGGPVAARPPKEAKQAPHGDDTGLGLAPPPVMERVG